MPLGCILCVKEEEKKSVHSVKDYDITIASNVTFSQQCNEFVKKKANKMMGLIKINFSFKNKDVVLIMYNSFV